MTTQPTPEQLAKWRVKFESRYVLSQLGTGDGRYLRQDVREAWGNYVEAREDALDENEQALKDARKQALEEAIALCCETEGGEYPVCKYTTLELAYKLKELLK